MSNLTLEQTADSMAGALNIAGLVAFSPVLRPWYRRWGAPDGLLRRRLPGDDQVPHPRIETTRAIDIQAPMDEVWPWLAQLGQRRGGWYSYEQLENLAGCEIENAERIVPEYQDIAVGDRLRLGPEGFPFFTVVEVIPERALVLKGGPVPPEEEDGVEWSWAFVLDTIDADTSRLVVRNRVDYDPTLANRIQWRGFVDPIAFVMERKMLRTIKDLAEDDRP